ncbi:MAG: alanine--tRNA ligase-related protein, partial [Candidatus Syntropharchaeia archaeon]
IRVLDMGMGQERNAWFSQGCETIYDATFPTVIKKLISATGLKVEKELMRKYVPHAGLLNLDEVEDVEKYWKLVAEKVGVDVEELKDFIIPLSGMYSIAEHMRSLLVALSDGGLPSNVGGGYNLRMLARRSMSFRERYGWDIELAKVCEWHARYLKPMFPELMENLDEIGKILDVEERKFKKMREKTVRIVERLMRKKKIDEEELLKIYDSHGIPPEIIREEFERRGRKIEIPEDFYSKVSELHEKKEQVTETGKSEKLPLEGIPDTKILYYGDYKKLEFRAKILKVIGKFVVLDCTCFYPTSGGQLHDTGEINGKKVKDVFKQGGVIVHEVESGHGLKEGEEVKGKVDWERRLKLSQQHTATHIINAAARSVLGNHVNQAGAKKTEAKSHLDITHYQPITVEEIKRIEKIANRVVRDGVKVEKLLMPRNEAEKRFGMRIYQGGAVPGKILRIVNIKGVDVEACGGTHVNNTKEIGRIKILKTTKIQDGVERIEFTAGREADKVSAMEEQIFEKVMVNLRKIADFKAGKEITEELRKCADFFSVPVDQLGKTVERFTTDILEYDKKFGSGVKKVRVKDMEGACKHLFNMWKRWRKEVEKFAKKRAKSEIEKLVKKAKNNKILEVVDMERKEMIRTADLLLASHPDLTIVLINKKGDVVGMSEVKDIVKEIGSFCKKFGGSGGGKGRLAQGKIDFSKFKKKG